MSTTVIEAQEFGAAVRDHRDRRGWTRPQLAMRLQQVDPDGDWKAERITHIERGNVRHPPLRVIRLLSIVLGCEVSDLVWPTPNSQSAWTVNDALSPFAERMEFAA